MKSLARSAVWWPKIDAYLEQKVKKCEKCQVNKKNPAVSLLHPWEWPKRPWVRIHIDHAGPFQGKLFLLVVNAHSKWMEVVIVLSTSSQATIKALKPMFSCHGLPELIVSDNGIAFTSSEFQEFTKRNGIRHLTTAPYHPASNGLAERAVQTLKESLKRSTDRDMDTCYRTTPHSTTILSPAELLMGRKPRSHLDLLQPDLSSKVVEKQAAQKKGHDQQAKERVFQKDDPVHARNFGDGPRWVPGVIVAVNGPCMFEIKLDDGRTVRRFGSGTTPNKHN